MSRALWMLSMILLAAGCSTGGNPAGQDANPLGHYSDPQALVKAVERGEAQADVFVQAVQKGPIRFEDVSPRAVANYLEAFAWERMLDRVPGGHIENEEMILSFETVFEDSRNVFNNWKAYKAFLKRAYNADVG